MDKTEAYGLLVELRKIINTTCLFVERKMEIPPAIISDLDRVGEMSKKMEIYVLMSKDSNFLNEVENTQRYTLHQLLGWYELSNKTRNSVTDCCAHLVNIAPQNLHSEESKNTENEPKQKLSETPKTLPKGLDTDKGTNFHSGETEINLTTIFEKLKEHKYFDANSDLQTWLYICCGNTTKQIPATPLNWIKDQQLLAHLVNTLFGDTDGSRLWSITSKIFTLKGEKPNTDTMKTTLSKIKNGYKDRPKEFDDLDNILKV
ncbi:MAG: hypothetical protein LBV72_07060 [Tannerella sp.]|jgi:hypothetical protein|nr:hypothetical protein [Tannerella sp.]